MMHIMTKEEKLKYLCKPHYHCHNGVWRAYFNRYAYTLYLTGRHSHLKAVLTEFPEFSIDYRILLRHKQRFLP